MSIAILLLFATGVAALATMAARDHRNALRERASLLDGLADFFEGGRVETGADGFPTLTGRLPDRREIVVSLLPDTLVMRRLPQLWLIVTLSERVEKPRPSIGALARHTGAEFYSRVLKFPERLGVPGLEALHLRGERRYAASDLERIGGVLGSIFHDPQMKEIAATPRGVRVVRQVSEGERGAHLLLRQARFADGRPSPDILARSIADADALREALDRVGPEWLRLSA